MALDLKLFHLINGLAGRMPILDSLMRLSADDYFLTTVMSLVLVALWFGDQGREERKRSQRAAILATVSLLLANVLLKLCNLAYFRPRPFAFHEVNLIYYRPTDSSFPSNPATTGFALATAVWLCHRYRAGAALFVMASLFSLSRIYCGVHYPSDVIAGAALGSLSAYLVVKKFGFLEPVVEFIEKVGRKIYLA